ncbi:MAG: hypothetical protein WDO15_27220 [Bacteroidota bacterium]
MLSQLSTAKTYDHSIQTISYDHIPTQTLVPPSTARLIRTDIRKEGGVIAYIRGAGDDVSNCLEKSWI